jgi:acyl-coenzyme A synthetase/AMP-(fatty) acid ligase/acyl carrier protein
MPECQLINGYGPTENTTFTTCYPITPASRLTPSVPIGRPIANTQVYVLDKQWQPVPIGVTGELYVGGDGLARDYLHQPRLTAEKFIPHPFAGQPGARLYSTGDLVRYRPDGTIEFLGRRDHQVKVRGFRIELGEIETVLKRHEAVQDVFVMVRTAAAQDKVLVAYVVPRWERPFLPSALRQYTATQLPPYMVPDVFVSLDTLPLNPNGKVDRNKLPQPEQSLAQEQPYATPITPTEQTIAAIWADLLGLEKVGLQHNFFDLGGHSLLIIQAMARIHQQFSIEIPMRTIFEAPALVDFAAKVDQLLQTQTTTSLISLTEMEEGIL